MKPKHEPADPILQQLSKHEPHNSKFPEPVKVLTCALKGVFPKSIVGDFVGISETSVGRLWASEDLSPSRIDGVKRNLTGKFYLRAAAALDFLTPEKLCKMNAYQLILTAGIALDKARLIEGLSTENVNFKSLAVTISAELADLREKKQTMLAENPWLLGTRGDVH